MTIKIIGVHRNLLRCIGELIATSINISTTQRKIQNKFPPLLSSMASMKYHPELTCSPLMHRRQLRRSHNQQLRIPRFFNILILQSADIEETNMGILPSMKLTRRHCLINRDGISRRIGNASNFPLLYIPGLPPVDTAFLLFFLV